MPNRGVFGNYEEQYKKKVKNVSLEIKNKLPLDEYLKGQSVINDSVGNINNYNNTNYDDYGINNNMSNSMSNSEVKQKTLVRTMNNPYTHMRSSAHTENDYIPRDYRGDSSFEINSSDMWNNRTGSTQTLVLIMTAILVVLVIAVSLVVMNYMGI